MDNKIDILVKKYEMIGKLYKEIYEYKNNKSL